MKKYALMTAMILLFSLSLVSAGMTRTAPTTVTPNSQFDVTYSVSNTGDWGASIVDLVSGGCKFPDGSSEYKSVMLSVDGSTKTIKVTAPSSGSCTFTGDYKFGTDSIINFPTKTVFVEVSSQDPVCGDGICESGESCTADCTSEPVCGDGICESGESCVSDCDSEPPSFSLDRVLFTLGDFDVTLLHVIIGFLVLFAVSFIK